MSIPVKGKHYHPGSSTFGGGFLKNNTDMVPRIIAAVRTLNKDVRDLLDMSISPLNVKYMYRLPTSILKTEKGLINFFFYFNGIES